jgi:alkylation response protein AidB-like acyl-CoA dehydrogenase
MDNYRHILSDEQLDFVSEVARFGQKEIAPRAKDIDTSNDFPLDLFRKMAEMGLYGAYFDEKWGGAGLDYETYVAIVTELSRHSGSVGVIFSVQVSLAAAPIDSFGTDEQKEKYLRPLLSGDAVGCYAMTEPDAGSDFANMNTQAVREGDHYRITGNKVFITNGAAADTCVLFARLGDKSGHQKRHGGITAFIVETASAGFTANKIHDELGMRGSGLSELVLEDVLVPAENLLGKEGEGFKIAMHTVDGGRAGISGQANGIAIAAYEQLVSYAQGRTIFGQKLSSFQNTQFKAAEMRAKIDASLLLTHHAAQLRTKPGAESLYSRKVSEAKWFAAQTVKEAAREALQLHGGYGYIGEYPAERYLRDSILIDIYEGTGEVQRTVIARHIFGRD